MRSQRVTSEYTRIKKRGFIAPLAEVLLCFLCPFTKTKQYLVRYQPTLEKASNICRSAIDQYEKRTEGTEGDAALTDDYLANRPRYLATAMHNYFSRLEFLLNNKRCFRRADTLFHKHAGVDFQVEGIDSPQERVAAPGSDDEGEGEGGNRNGNGRRNRNQLHFRVHWSPEFLDLQQMKDGWPTMLAKFEAALSSDGEHKFSLTEAEEERYLEGHTNPIIRRLRRLTEEESTGWVRRQVVTRTRQQFAIAKRLRAKRRRGGF